MISSVKINNAEANINRLNLSQTSVTKGLQKVKNSFEKNEIKTGATLNGGVAFARYIVFLKPDSSFRSKDFPAFVLKVDGKKVEPTVQQQNGSWATYSYEVTGAGDHNFQLKVNETDKVKDWKGEATVWMTTQQKQPGKHVDITTEEAIKIPPMPPSPYAEGSLMQNEYIGKGELSL